MQTHFWFNSQLTNMSFGRDVVTPFILAYKGINRFFFNYKGAHFPTSIKGMPR